MNGQHKIPCLIKRPRHSELEFVGGISIYQYNTLGMFVRYPKIKNFFFNNTFSLCVKNWFDSF